MVKLILETLQPTKMETIYERLLGTGGKNDLSIEELEEPFHSVLYANLWDLYVEEDSNDA